VALHAARVGKQENNLILRGVEEDTLVATPASLDPLRGPKWHRAADNTGRPLCLEAEPEYEK
jgi:hypothetical protein